MPGESQPEPDRPSLGQHPAGAVFETRLSANDPCQPPLQAFSTEQSIRTG